MKEFSFERSRLHRLHQTERVALSFERLLRFFPRLAGPFRGNVHPFEEISVVRTERHALDRNGVEGRAQESRHRARR